MILSVEKGVIPSAQYGDVLIDEGHDFRPEWFRLVLYDDAQSIYESGKKKNFSFKSVGIQAHGRATVFKVNYRNTQEILEFATQFSSDFLNGSDADDDGVPCLSPVSAGRHGSEPVVVQPPTLFDEEAWIANTLKQEHEKGIHWRDMAVLYRHYDQVCKGVRAELKKAGIPTTWKDDVLFSESQSTVKLVLFHSSKGLELPVVVIPGADLMLGNPTKGEARLLYVAMTRATSCLYVIGTN